MICTLEVYIGKERHSVFLQQGFYASSMPTTHFHNHNYTEIHLVSGGTACFQVGERIFEVNEGDMLVIPRNLFHYCFFKEEQTTHIAFQIDCEGEACAVCSLPDGVVADFLKEIQNLSDSKNYTKIAAYLSFIGAFLETSSSVFPQKIMDYGFLIHEFFSIHYRENVHLGDLARELCLSERQTERLVLEYTGKTFRKALAHTRLSIACQLIKLSDLPLAEIARYVGYESYAGFWKAMQKYRDEKQEK